MYKRYTEDNTTFTYRLYMVSIPVLMLLLFYNRPPPQQPSLYFLHSGQK